MSDKRPVSRRYSPTRWRLIFICFLATVLPLFSSETSSDERTLWDLERAHWRYVEDNNLPAYLNLWRHDLVAWPWGSSAPVGKAHMTDWITSQTSKGLAFKAGELKPAALKVTGEVAFVCYWITFRWVDKAGNGAAHTLRVTHAWLRTGKDWRIIGGMSVPEPQSPSK